MISESGLELVPGLRLIRVPCHGTQRVRFKLYTLTERAGLALRVISPYSESSPPLARETRMSQSSGTRR
jgi:hypothetical protein